MAIIPTSISPATFSMDILAHDKKKRVTYVRLPRELWRAITPGCNCDVCKRNGGVGYWDTLVVPSGQKSGHKHTYTIHMPDETVAAFIEYLDIEYLDRPSAK